MKKILFPLLFLTFANALGDDYPFTKSVAQLISEDRVEQFPELAFRCASVLNMLIDTGYADGEGLRDRINNYYEATYRFGLVSYAQTRNKLPSQSSSAEEQAKQWDKYGEEVFDSIWNKKIVINQRAYAKWGNANKVTHDVLQNPDHPWTIDQKGCFDLGDKLMSIFNAK